MLYNKYRPKVFEDVIGQPASIVLQNAIKHDRHPSSVLLSGTRGVGKTTLARIYGYALNCETEEPCGYCESCKRRDHPDIYEIDSTRYGNTSDVEKIVGTANLVPTYKMNVLIFDEAHTLSKKAMGLLLKTVEEPKARSVVLFATTAPDKIDIALRSRCMWLQLSRVSEIDIAKMVAKISKKEGIKISIPALMRIAKYADGSPRDALSLLETMLHIHPVTEETLDTVVGRKVDATTILDWLVVGNVLGALTETQNVCRMYDSSVILDSLVHECMQRLEADKVQGQEAKFYIAAAHIFQSYRSMRVDYLNSLPVEMSIAEISSIIEKRFDWGVFLRLLSKQNPELFHGIAKMKMVRIKGETTVILKGETSELPITINKALEQIGFPGLQVRII